MEHACLCKEIQQVDIICIIIMVPYKMFTTTTEADFRTMYVLPHPDQETKIFVINSVAEKICPLYLID